MLEETFQKSHVSSSGVLKLTSFSQTRAMTRRRSVRPRVLARSDQGSRRVRRRTNSPPQPHVRTSSSDPPTMQANCRHSRDFGAISRWINVSLRVRSSRTTQVTSQPRAVHARPRVRQPFVGDAAIGGRSVQCALSRLGDCDSTPPNRRSRPAKARIAAWKSSTEKSGHRTSVTCNSA